MQNDVRIQLEGQLEKVERAVAAWEKAAQSLQGSAWRISGLFTLLDAIGPEVEAAVKDVQRKVSVEPALKVPLARLDEAQQHVRERALQRLRRVGVTPESTELPALLNALRAEHPIAHQERLGWEPWQPALAAVVCVGVAAVAFAIPARPYPAWLIPLVPSVVFAVSQWLASTPILVTARTLVIGKEAVPIADVLLVTARIAKIPNRRWKRCELEVVSRQRIFKVWSAGKPTRLIAVLKERGVKVEVDTDWNFFFW